MTRFFYFILPVAALLAFAGYYYGVFYKAQVAKEEAEAAHKAAEDAPRDHSGAAMKTLLSVLALCGLGLCCGCDVKVDTPKDVIISDPPDVIVDKPDVIVDKPDIIKTE